MESNMVIVKEQLQQQREEHMKERHEMKHSHSEDLHLLQTQHSDLQEQLTMVRVPHSQVKLL